MSGIHALSGAYAVDALDDAERTEFERHLATCADCRAEVQSFLETAALISEAESVPPPASMRDRVLADIGTVRPFPPAAPAPEHLASVTTLRRRGLPTLVAAAVAMILLASGVAAWHPWSTTHASVADEVISASDAVRVTRHLASGGDLTLVRSASLERAVLISDHVAAPTAGEVYQLWLRQPGTGMVSAGLVSDTSDTTVLTGDTATATLAAITIEPETGSAHPTTAPIAKFPLRSKT
jgi:anti-sigma-K factor RskA